MNARDVAIMLQEACAEAGSQKAFAELHRLSLSYVNDVYHYKRLPGDSILRALGLEARTTYHIKDYGP